jgi:hypothetical protein
MDTFGPRLASVALVAALVVGSQLAGAAWSWSADDRPVGAETPASEVLVLTGDVDVRTRQLAAIVVEAARRHDLPLGRLEVDVREVDRVGAGTPLDGRTDGRSIVVGRNVALPDRALVHEFAHVVVGLEDAHGDLWRRVYLTAIEAAFDREMRASEQRRIEWVYDRTYLDR